MKARCVEKPSRVASERTGVHWPNQPPPHLAVKFGRAIVNNGRRGSAFLLCIDTWLGDLNMFLNKRDFASSLTWRAGEPGPRCCLQHTPAAGSDTGAAYWGAK